MFFGNEDFRQNGEDINIDINNVNTNTNFNMNEMNETGMMGTVSGPIIEPGKERIIQRNIIHEVRHACQFLQEFSILSSH